jgi:hypothetical protein
MSAGRKILNNSQVLNRSPNCEKSMGYKGVAKYLILMTLIIKKIMYSRKVIKKARYFLLVSNNNTMVVKSNMSDSKNQAIVFIYIIFLVIAR